MALLHTPAVELGTQAPDFNLKDTEGKAWTRKEAAGDKGLMVMFICNHCPYVKTIISNIALDAKILQEAGIGVIAIMPNDTHKFPSDSFEKMQEFAAEHNFTFPYVIDETQDIAKAYGAVCTPDFFGYDAQSTLQYRGRLDAVNPSHPATPDTRRELRDAMLQIAKTGTTSDVQTPSMGCSIKWKEPHAA